MKNHTRYSRRQFLQRTVVTSAACGLAQLSVADDAKPLAAESQDQIVDTHVYVGRWPFRHLSADDPGDLAATLQKNSVTEAWVGTFDSLLHKDIGGANERLAELCRSVPDCVLRPFGSVNPTLPDWEEDVRRCHEDFHMAGIRLHPNYHGYKLDDPRFGRLLDLATARHLVVQIVTWLDDERHPYLNPPVQEVDLGPLEKAVASVRGSQLVVANAFRTLEDKFVSRLAQMPQLYFDFARLDAHVEMAELVRVIPADRVVFGSCAPLLEFGSARSQLRRTKLDKDQRVAIQSKTARGLVSPSVK